MKELKDVARKAGIIVSGRIIGQSLDLITILIITRFIGAEIYGRYIYVFALINFIPVFANIGMTNGLLAVIPKYQVSGETVKRNSVISFSLLLGLILSVIGVVLIYVFMDNIGATVFKGDSSYNSILMMMAPLAILSTVNSIMQYALRGLGGVRYFVYSTDLIMPILKMASMIIFMLMNFKIEALILSLYVSFVGVFLYLLSGIFKYKLLERINRCYISEYKELILFSLPLMLSGAIGIVITQVDTIMIGYFMKPEDVAVYRIISKLATLIVMILSSFNIAYAPKISELYHKGHMKQIESMYKTITRWTTTFGVLIFGFIAADSKEILRVFFGEQYIIGSTALIILCFGQLVNAATGSVTQINIMTGHSAQHFYSQIFNMVFKVILNLLFIQILGIKGAAIAAMVCLSSVNILRVIMVYLNLKIHPFEISILKSIISMIFGIVIVMLINVLINGNGIGALLIEGISYTIAFILLILISGVNKEDKELINNMIISMSNRIKKK